MKLKEVKKMYFLGLGGIGMSALSRYCSTLGIEIHGYDLTPTKLTNRLADEGMQIHYEDNVSLIPDDLDLVIYTPAIPKTNKEFQYFQNSNIEMLKRSQLLGLLSEEFFTIAVAGTHGKTSISSIIAHILYQANVNVSAIIGGIMNNYGTNAIINGKTEYLVVEADEFDRSFHYLHPDMSVISSVDNDHLDIYSDNASLLNAFEIFASKTNENGLLIKCDKLDSFAKNSGNCLSYGFGKNADVKAENVHIDAGKFVFDLHYKDVLINDIHMQIPGRHYIENALAAASVALKLDLSVKEIKAGLETFSGVERRFEYKINTDKIVFIDDYAHHPQEIESTLDAVKELYPLKKMLVVFQPHLFSRTADFADGFAQSLERADEIILLDIYPARELPRPGVDSNLILGKIKNKNKRLLSKEELKKYVKEENIELLVSLGAGDIGAMVNDLKEILE
ncbi:MAG: UDP-N-acetylmuramate--L-alanine ligase [Marinilabiliales bacterium]|nr:MAG: UDP-N-acetylmuramate--L-alanine ligase [Marinilabiliales bacterium]